MSDNTVFLRLEGPLQAWGDNQSKFIIRRTSGFPTKSGVIGLVCAALGVNRKDAANYWLPALKGLKMGVRIDYPGIRWWDYHTIGEGQLMQIAESTGKARMGPLPTRREYLCDSSFLVAIRGDETVIHQIASAIQRPIWSLYLGRKCCVPSKPIFSGSGRFDSMIMALSSVPIESRVEFPDLPQSVTVVRDPDSPSELTGWNGLKEIIYDLPLSFDPPVHEPRFVLHDKLAIETVSINVKRGGSIPAPPRPRADYSNTAYKKIRIERLGLDHHLCVFCKAPATTVQHIIYPDNPGEEQIENLASLCRLCHDAITMLEYGAGMGRYRIDPSDPMWRERIVQKRESIIRHRSVELRRRRLSGELD